jgi:iron complex outermembrane receptor protein
MGRRRARRALPWITAALVTSLVISNAQAAGFSTALPPQQLADALDVFSRATGYQVIYRADLTAGVATPGAEAGLTVIETLRQLLRGTGLGFKFINDRTIAIVKLPASESSRPAPPEGPADRAEQSPLVPDAGAPPSAATDMRGDKDVKHRGFWGRIAGFFTLCGSFAAAGAACAQEQAVNPPQAAQDELQEIVVTGTLIRGVAPIGTNVVGLSSSDITETGALNTNQVLAKIPQNTAAFNSVPVLQSTNYAIAVVRPNLRNLSAVGGSTTLVLIDGHRAVDVGILQTSPDPDVIPPALLDRIEVVPDGGSSVYGSDAVGGVINLITKKRFDGFQADGHYGFASDYRTYDISATAGKDWEKGSGYLSYTFADHDPIFGRDRGYVHEISSDTGFCAPGTVTAGGQTYALPDRVPGTATHCDALANSSFIPADRRHSLFAGLTQQLSDSITFELKGLYTHRETTNYVDYNLGVGILPLAQTGTITAVNPYYVPIAGDGGSQTVQFSYNGLFSNEATFELDEYQVTPTITADLGSDWQLRALGSFGRSVNVSHSPTFDATAQAAALAGTTLGTALDPYNPGSSSPAVLASVYRDQYGRAVQNLENARLIADGPLHSLPGGELHLAVGAEWIHEGYSAHYGNIIPGQPDTAPGGIAARNVKSAFGEFSIPIVGTKNAMPMLEALTLSLSGRYDNYSDFGGTFNPKFGATFKPVDWIALRGNWGTAFNAPSLADTSGAVSNVQVIPASPWIAPGDPFFPTVLRSTVILAGGRANTRPQTAHTWSLGGDVHVPFVPGLTISATYYNIFLKQQIGLIPFYTPAAFTPPYASFVTKNPTLAQLQAAAGNLALIGTPSLAALYGGPNGDPYVLFDARRQNLGELKQDGVDFNTNYRYPMSLGSVSASLAGTYTLHRTQAPLAGLAFTDALGTPGSSRLSLVASLGAVLGHVTTTVSLNHSQGYDLNPVLVTPKFGAQSHVDAFDTVDLFFGYDFEATSGVTKDLSLTLNLTNLFDRDPPFYNADPGYANGLTLGRLVQFGIRKKL